MWKRETRHLEGLKCQKLWAGLEWRWIESFGECEGYEVTAGSLLTVRSVIFDVKKVDG